MTEYETLTFTAAGASFSITPFGGHLLSYTPPSSSGSILWLSNTHVRDQSKSIRGGIPVCFPQFGSVHDKNSPQHGWARLQLWTVESSSESPSGASVTLTLSSSSNQTPGRPDNGMWPVGAACPYSTTLTLCVSLDATGALDYNLAVRNCGVSTLPYQILLHNYFQVDSLSDTFGVRALADAQVVDTQPRGMEGLGHLHFPHKTDEDITVDGEVDRILHTNESALVVTINRGTNNLAGDQITLSVTTTPSVPLSFVVWNPYIDKSLAMPDFDDDGYKHMICVEPGIINGMQSLKGGETQSIRMNLTVSSSFNSP
jgi:glucose-6-phosphate 1-epimerase